MKYGAIAGTGEADVALVIGDDFFCAGEAEAVALFFGGEDLFEDFGLVLFGDADTGIGDVDEDVFGLGLVDDVDVEDAGVDVRLGHGVDGVDDEIGEDFVHGGVIGIDGGTMGGEVLIYLDVVGGEFAIEIFEDVLEEGDDVEGFFLIFVIATLEEDVIDDV